MVDYKACCRLCLDPEGNLQSLLQNGIIYEKELQQKILKSLEVEILADDKLTTMICANCIEKINNWQTFKRTCTENQSKLEEWFTASTAATTNVQSSNDISNNDIQIKEEPIENVIIPPPEVILTNGDGPVMKNEPIEEDFNDLPPPLTPQGEETEEVEVVAYSENDNNVMNPDTSQDSEIIADPRRCKTCSKLLSSVTNRKKHEKVMHGVRNRNTFPVAGGSTDSDLGLLRQALRKPLKLKDCPDCGKQFLHESSLRQHRRVHMKIKLLSDPDEEDRKPLKTMPQIILLCELCHSIFASKEDLRDHKFIKHGESMANFSTTNSQASNDLVDEQEMMRRQFNKKCNYCPIKFRCPTQYFNHVENHIKRKKKAALETAKLKQVSPKKRKKLPNTSGESYQTCRFCYKVLNNKSRLKAHLKSHHGHVRKASQPSEKQTKDFKSNGKKQTKVNETEREKLHCGFCSSICTSAARLTKHVHLKHNDKINENIFYCKPCKKSFPRINALHCHQFWKHKDDSSIRIDESKALNNSRKSAKEARNVEKKTEKQNVEKKTEKQNVEKKTENQNVEKKAAVKQEYKREPQRQSLRKRLTADWSIKETGKLKDEKGLVKHNEKEMEKNKQQQIKESPVKTKPLFTCTTCDAECPNATALQVHLLEKHGQQALKEKDKIGRSIPYRCNVCNLNFTVQSSYEDHRRFHALVEQPKHTYACNHCTAAFDKLETLRLHLENSHTKLQCHHCEKEFETPTSLNIHIAVAHRKQKAIASATTTSTHFEHYHSQLQPQLFKCQECDSVFEKVGSLNIHLVVVHEKQNMITDKNKTAVAVPTFVKRFACTICGLGFDDTKQLEVHVQAHSLRSRYQ